MSETVRAREATSDPSGLDAVLWIHPEGWSGQHLVF